MFCPVSPGDIFQTIFCEISNFRQFINSYLVKEIQLGKCCLGKRFSPRSQPPHVRPTQINLDYRSSISIPHTNALPQEFELFGICHNPAFIEYIPSKFLIF